MALVEVTKIEKHDAPGVRFAIDAPAKGARFDVHELAISGWAIGDDSPVTAIHFSHEQISLREAPVRLPRKDLAPKLGPAADSCGFWANLGLLALGEDVQILVRAILQNGGAVPLATVTLRRTPLRNAAHLRMQPIMVTNLGRCGSTLIMRMLAEHPDIVVHPHHPMETRILGYYLHMTKVLSDPASHFQSSHPNTYQHDPFWVGSHPHHMYPLMSEPLQRDFFGRFYPELLGETAQRASDEFYFRAAMAQGRQKTPAFFAEKANPNHVPRMMWELYPNAREIFLVRDFRDMVRSMLDWYRKLGAVSFGRDESGSDIDFVKSHRFEVERILRHYQQRKDRAFLLHYENLVREPEKTLAGVLEYIGVSAARSTVEEMVRRANADSPDFQKHRTSGSVNASIGRWRTWPAELVEACHESFDDLLPHFGYDPAGDGIMISPARQRARDNLPKPVRDALPWGATVAVVSKGDDTALKAVSDDARHFPADDSGQYLGYYPADAAEAITHVEKTRSAGAAYLYFPRDAMWWLDHYAGLRAYLDQQCAKLVCDAESGALYRLHAATPAGAR